MLAKAVDPARRDHIHQALFYSSDAEFMAVIVPFGEAAARGDRRVHSVSSASLSVSNRKAL